MACRWQPPFVFLGEVIKMFQINDIVLYNQTEVCRVEDIRVMPFLDSQRINYYVLKPIYDDSPANSTIYVPVMTDETRLRRAFSADELKQMLAGDGTDTPWIENATLRRRAFADILSRSHPGELIGLIRVLSDHRSKQLSAGRRFSDTDEKTLIAAEKQLYPLFRYILNVSQPDFLAMVTGESAALVSDA